MSKDWWNRGKEPLLRDETPQIPDASLPGSKLAGGAVTFAKAKTFVSTEQTGNGSAQSIAHGLGAVPSAILVIPTDLTAVTVGQYSAVEGTHTSTNVVVTVTSGKKYKVLAWA
jgi:hypothetical protein